MKSSISAIVVALMVATVASAIVYSLLHNDIESLQMNVNTLRQDVTQLQNGQPAIVSVTQSPTNSASDDSKSNANGADHGQLAPINTGIATNQPGNLKSHAAYFTTSSDPNQFTDSVDPIFTAASVPEVVALTQDSPAGNAGDLLLYFVDAENFTGPNTESLGYAKSTDGGQTWSEKQHITIADKVNAGAVVDPSAVQLDDGRVRLYYFGSKVTSGDPASAPGDHVIYSAISDDGLNFTIEPGERFHLAQVTDPEVVRLDDAWIMYISIGPTTAITTSTDGLTFTATGVTWDGGGVPGAFVDAADVVHLYGCGQGGIMTQTSADGVHFDSSTQPTRALSYAGVICDPSPVLLANGTIGMVYKKIDEAGQIK